MPEPKHNREDYLINHDPEQETTRQESATAIEKVIEKAEGFTDHLQELRNRIAIVIFTIIVSSMTCFYFSGDIIKVLQAAAPEGASFFQLKPGELFMSSFKVAIYLGLVLAMPVLLQQISGFMKPGLSKKERRVLQPIFIGAPLLFLAGISFAYYFVLPPLLDFLLGFRTGVVETRYGLEHFLNLEISILGLCGLTFQLPIVLITISLLNLVKSNQLMAIWRYVVLSSFVIAAILTPTPDPLTMTVVASAMLGLYFSTVAVLKLLKK